jgi:hypothetical protein
MTNANPQNPVIVNYHLKLNSTTTLINRMNPLLKLLDEKKWNASDLAREYGKRESPELSSEEAIKKYGSLMRKALKNPEDIKHRVVKKVVETLGGELIIRVNHVNDISF